MKTQILFLVLLVLAAPAYASVQISEVYYDPITTEYHGEALELYNSGSGPVDISGYVISTKTSATDAVLPQGAVIPAKGYYLITDTGWETGRDNASWPDADYEEDITLTNTDGGVALKNGNNSLLDAVGWGNPSNIPAGLYEGTPHSGVKEGISLQRIKDTNDNSADFIAAYPDWKNSKSTPSINGTGLILTINITSIAPVIENITILTDDDSLTAGSQVMPLPNSQKDVKISARITFPGGYNANCTAVASLNSKSYSMVKASQVNANTVLFNGTLRMEYYDEPKNYTITVTATNQHNIVSSSVKSFEYLSLTGIELDAASLSCNLAAGSVCDIIGDRNMSTPNKVTVKNIGNTVVDVGVAGTNFVSGSSSIPVGSIEYAFSSAFTNPVALSSSSQLNNIDLEYGAASLKELSFRIHSPVGTPSGSYVGRISVMAVKSD